MGTDARAATFRLLDLYAHLECDDAALWERARRLLREFAIVDDGAAASLSIRITGTSDDPDLGVMVDGEERFRGWPTPVLAYALGELNGAAVRAFDGLALHAGVVARDGRAIAFPATSGAGKSTLTAACLQAGFDYVSDEALCLRYGTVEAVPYPKPLAIAGTSAEMLGLSSRRWDTKDLVPAQKFGACVVSAPPVVEHVVLMERAAGASELEPLPPSAATQLVLSMAFNSFRDPVAAMQTATGVAASAHAWKLSVGRPLEAAQLLYDLSAMPAVRAPST